MPRQPVTLRSSEFKSSFYELLLLNKDTQNINCPLTYDGLTIQKVRPLFMDGDIRQIRFNSWFNVRFELSRNEKMNEHFGRGCDDSNVSDFA